MFGYSLPLTTLDFVSATATDSSGNRSEFAQDLAITQAPDNIISEVTLASTGFSYSRSTDEYTQTVTILNTSAATLAPPIYLELADLPSGGMLVSPSATTTSSATPPAGSVAAQVSSSPLPVNQSITIVLVFTDPSNVVINYVPEALSDPNPL